MGKNLAVFWDSCFSLHSFWVENAKINCFWEKIILRAFLINLKCKWLQSGLSDLEKHKILPFLLMVDFLRTFEITHFLRFLKYF